MKPSEIIRIAEDLCLTSREVAVLESVVDTCESGTPPWAKLIADRLSIPAPEVFRSIRKLHRHELVKLSPYAGNRKYKLCEPTPLGSKVITDMRTPETT